MYMYIILFSRTPFTNTGCRTPARTPLRKTNTVRRRRRRRTPPRRGPPPHDGARGPEPRQCGRKGARKGVF